MTLSDLARILRHSDFKDRLRHVDCDRRTIHLGSSFHRGLWTQGDFGTSMPFKSREESIPSSFGAIGEACQAAIAARSTVLRRTHPRWLLRASVARWDGIHQVLPTRGDCLRKELSSEKCRRHAPFPFARYAQGAWTRVASWPQASSRGLSWSVHGDRSGPHPWSRRRGARPLPRVRALARRRPVLPGVRAGARRAAGRLRAAART